MLDEKALTAAKTAWRHRNDFHHLNPGVSTLDLKTKAKECVDAICALEENVFSVSMVNGALSPKNPVYWDTGADNTVTIFLRQLDA